MIELNRINGMNKLASFSWDKSDYVICGSAVLVAYGIIENNQDIDITVNEKLWKNLKRDYEIKIKSVKGINKEYIQIDNIEIMHTVDGIFSQYNSVDELIEHSVNMRGYNFCNLQDTIIVMEYLNRNKDKDRLKLVKKFLKV